MLAVWSRQTNVGELREFISARIVQTLIDGVFNLRVFIFIAFYLSKFSKILHLRFCEVWIWYRIIELKSQKISHRWRDKWPPIPELNPRYLQCMLSCQTFFEVVREGRIFQNRNLHTWMVSFGWSRRHFNQEVTT